MAGVYKGLNIKFGADTTSLDQALGKISSKGNKLTRELKQVEKALKVDPRNTELLKQKFEGLGKQVTNTEQKLKALKDAEANIGKSGMSTEQWDKLQRDIALTESSLKNYKNQFKEANAQYAAATSGLGQVGSKISEIGQTLTPVGEQLQSFGGKMTATLTTAAVAAGAASVKMATDFETSLAKVSTLMDESVMSVEEMGEGARKLATEYGVSATEINEALYQAQSASVDTAKALEFVGEATKLSKAGFTDSATAVDTLTTAINAYGMSAEDAAHISNVLVNTQNLGKTTVNELGSSMGNVIPTAAAYNVSLENLASAYVVMTKQGINTANATTALNGMMTELSSEGSEVSNVLKEKTGKSFGQLMKDGESLGDVLSILYDSVNGDSEAFANLWGNVRASKGALALANGGVEEFNSTLDSMVDSAGVVDAAFAKMGDTTQAQFNKMKAQVEDAAITVGQAMLPIVQDVVGVVTDVADAFNNMSESEQRSVIEMAAFVAGIGPALTLLGTLMVSVERVGNGMMSFATLLAKVDVATGGIGRGFKEVTNAAGETVKVAKTASVAMGALKVSAAAAAVAGIAILVSAIKDYVDRCNTYKAATDGLVNATEALNADLSSTSGAIGEANAAFGNGKVILGNYGKEVDKLAEKQAKLADEISDSFSEVGQKNGALQIYADKIEELAGHCDGSAEKLAELQVAIDGYNSIAGTAYSITDTTTGAIDASTDALQANADAWKANAEAAALQSALTKILEERIELEQMEADSAESVARAEAALANAQSPEEAAQYAAQLEQANKAHEDAVRLLDANVKSEEQLTKRKVESDKAYKTATSTLDDYAKALEESGRSVEDLDAVMSTLGKESTQEVVDAFKAAGISAEDFADVGVDAFNLLYQQSGQDMSKVKENIDMLNACGIDPKNLEVTDKGTIDKESGRVVDLDKQTIDDKSFKVEAETYQAEQSLWNLRDALSSIRDKVVNVTVNKQGQEASGGFYKLHASGGFITNGITSLGVDRYGVEHIAGEAGREWIKKHADGTTSIVPIENKRYLKPYAEDIASMIGDSAGSTNNYSYNITVNASGDGDDIARQVTRAIRAQELMRGRR